MNDDKGFRPVLLVPHYNHAAQFERYVPELLAQDVPLLVVDDGSDTAERERLERLAATRGFQLLGLAVNRGKGAALVVGFEHAAAAGYSHALQIDADGQHEPRDIPRFLASAQSRPGTLICGAPVFGDDAPWVRVWGRKLTDAVVFLETWSRSVRDSLCGFRVYPLAQILPLVREHPPGARMDFDADLLVRARWRGIPLHFLDTQVRYPNEGRSHFRYVRDNVRMVILHVRLLATMLLRSPWLLADRLAGRAGTVTGE